MKVSIFVALLLATVGLCQKQLPLSSVNGEEYYIKATVGTVDFDLLVDVQADYSWVPAATCDACRYKTKYDPTHDHDTGTNGEVTHVEPPHEYTASGKIYEGTMTISTARVNPLQFIVATSADLQTYMTSGILGLSLKSFEHNENHNNPLANMALDANVIQIKYDFFDSQGKVLFGSYDKKLDYEWFDCTDGWTLSPQSLSFDGSHFTSLGASSKAELNTRIPGIAFHEDVFGWFEKTLPCSSASRCIVDEDNFDLFPHIELKIKDKMVDIPPQDYVLFTPYANHQYRAIISISAYPSTTGKWGDMILGTSFLSHYVTVFDYDNKKVGLHKLDKDNFVSRGTDVLISKSLIMILLIIFGAAIAILIGLACFACCCHKPSKVVYVQIPAKPAHQL